MKQFNVPIYYNSKIIDGVRKIREKYDPRKKDITPSIIKIDTLTLYIGRHFGFCYGVKNAIEICYEAIRNYPNKKIYLLSQMIHNQMVNQDLKENGISFIMNTNGTQLIPWTKIKKDDIVIIPAFGTSLEVLDILNKKGVRTKQFDTTCPFVSKVWNRAEKISSDGHTIVIYGAANHEETRSTFSRAKKNGPAIIVENMKDVHFLCQVINKKHSVTEFYKKFHNKMSPDFNMEKDLVKIGVVNQTTMLASDTKKIIETFTLTFNTIYGKENSMNHIANTRDTLCYATNENQDSTLNLLKKNVDMAIVVGGYNSSNTTHLAELTSKKTNTFFINSSKNISLDNKILHFDIKTKKQIETINFLPKKKCKIILTSGASCPDIILEKIILRLMEIHKIKPNYNDILDKVEKQYTN